MVSELERIIRLASTKGLHAELASKIVALAGKYHAEVQIKYENQIINAKSVLGLISLAIPYGENLEIIATGTDAEKAVEKIRKLLSKEV